MSAAARVNIRCQGQYVSFGLNEDSQYTRSPSQTGAAGWQLVDRMRQQASTEWTDSGPWQLTMNLMVCHYDFSQTGSLESTISLVESWEMPVPKLYPPQPPTLKVVAGPVPHHEVTWFVYDLTWGNALRNTDGDRFYQELQLILWQYLPSRITVTSKSAAAKARIAAQAVGAAPTARYTVKSGDTLQSIASSKLGDWSKWISIATANGLRSSNQLIPGQTLVIP